MPDPDKPELMPHRKATLHDGCVPLSRKARKGTLAVLHVRSNDADLRCEPGG